MPELEHIDAADVTALVAALDRDGACIARNMLATAACDALLADFAPALAAMPWGTDELGYRDNFYGSRTKRLHGLFSQSAQMTAVLLHPTLQALTHQRFLASKLARDVRLSNAELMVLAPGQSTQVLHRDGASWPEAQAQWSQDLLLSANYALTDFTKDNGATVVVPGSQHWETGRTATPQECCLATMPKGSALLYGGNTLHAGGNNQSDAIRTGLYLGFIPSWLRPLENQLLTNQPDAVRTLPADAQRLLDVVDGGFTVYA